MLACKLLCRGPWLYPCRLAYCIAVPGLSPCWLANCYAVDRGHVHVGLHIAVPGSSPCWLANCHAVVMSMSVCILYCCAGLESMLACHIAVPGLSSFCLACCAEVKFVLCNRWLMSRPVRRPTAAAHSVVPYCTCSSSRLRFPR
jgi:hypothetical protein